MDVFKINDDDDDDDDDVYLYIKTSNKKKDFPTYLPLFSKDCYPKHRYIFLALFLWPTFTLAWW